MKLGLLVLAILIPACAQSALRLPRLRARGWIGLPSAGATAIGGEIGLVMPLDPAFGAGSEPEEEPESEDEAAAPIALLARAVPCRVPIACGWERAERARALARLEEGDGR